MVVRDSDGDVVVSAVQQGPNVLGPEMEEAWACRYAVRIAVQHGFKNVIIEGDC